MYWLFRLDGCWQKIKGYLKSEALYKQPCKKLWGSHHKRAPLNFPFNLQLSAHLSLQACNFHRLFHRRLPEISFFFQNRHLLEDFKKAPSDTLGLSPKEIYLVTVFRVSNYGNSIGTFVRVLLKTTWINGFCRWTNLLQSDANKSKLLQVHRWSKYFLLKWESWQFCVSTLFCWSALAEVY